MSGLSNVWDVIIVGSGIAGLYTALNVDENSRTLIITKGDIQESNSYNAQGGIAAAIGEDDNPDIHFRDTIKAGDGLCNPEAVKILVYSAPGIVKELIRLGVEFDRDETGKLDLGREGAHSRRRVLHSKGDSTGRAIMEVLVRHIREREIPVKDETMVLKLIVEDNICRGVLVWDKKSEMIYPLFSKVVILATGGIGQIYPFTTNPSVACGDGLAIAYDAGVELCDMEFVQFHPTVLKHPSAPPLLITESIRGEGGILRNIYGERFVPKYHEMGELAPRDVVSRIITEEMERTNSDYVYLDITHLSKEFILSHFPMIYSECLKYGIDITRDYIPVAPGAHYMMGGIRTNLKGETCIKGLYACGECAGTGIHGANRMASNSLLEGLVFGKIIAQEVSEYVLNNGNISTLDMEVTKKEVCKEEILREFRVEMQNLMWKYCGIRRKEEGLRTLLERLEKMQQEVKDMPVNNFKDVETKNMLVLSKLIAESALERRESRGAHFREDYPYRDDIYWQKHIIKKKGRV